MYRIGFLFIVLSFFAINYTYANGDPCDPKICQKCQSNKCVIYIDRENPANQTILGQILADISELKKTIAQFDPNSSRNQTEWDKILSIPTFGILIASFVLTVLAVGLAVGSFFGFKSLKEAKENYVKGTEKLREEFQNKIKENIVKSDKIHEDLHEDHDKLEVNTNKMWFLLNNHLGYMYWTLSLLIEDLRMGGNSENGSPNENATEIQKQLMSNAIFFTKEGLDTIDKVNDGDKSEDKYTEAGLTSEEKYSVSIINAKITLAFFYAFLNLKEKQNDALRLIEEADLLINPLLRYDIVAKNNVPMWTANSLFVKLKFASDDRQESIRNSLQDLSDRYPTMKKKVDKFLEWSR